MTTAFHSSSVAVTLGDGLGLISDTTLALLDTDNGDLAERLWALVSSGSGVDELLEELSATGLRSLGSFALAQIEDGAIRVVVRGEARAWISTPTDGHAEHDAGAVRTWVEHVEPGANRVALSLRGNEPVESPFRAGSALLPAVGLVWPAAEHGEGALLDLDNSTVADDLLRLEPMSATVSSGDTAAAPDRGGPANDPETPPLPEPDPVAGAEPAVAPTERDGVAPKAERVEPDGAALAAERVEPDGVLTDADPVEPWMSDPPTPDVAPAIDTSETIHIRRYVEDDESSAEGRDDDVDGYDDLWGHTVHRSVQNAAVDAAEPDAEAVDPPPPVIEGIPGVDASPTAQNQPGDHDGLTISAAQLRAMRQEAGSAPTPAAPPSPLGGPTVQAIACRAGHHNPPHLSLCRVCGQQLDGTPLTIARPRLGTIRFSTGDLVELDRPAILGRNPKIEGQFPNELPQTVVIDAGKAVSRSHLLIRLEGWQVWVEDLGSANGTTITLPGQAPQRLRSGEPFLLEAGARINLGDEVDGTFETS